MFGISLSDEQVKDIFKEKFNPRLFQLDELWMVVWIGKLFIAQDGNMVFQVFLARIAQRNLSTINVNSLEYSKGQVLEFPVSMIKLVPPGTIFQGGDKLKGKQYEHLRKYRFSIEPGSLEAIPLKDFVHGQELRTKLALASIKTGYSKTENSSSKNFGQLSRLLAVKNTNAHIEADYIIFPAAEVARFHWFSSTIMTRTIINHNHYSVADNPFYVTKSLQLPTDETPYHFLRIKDKMRKKDVARIARLAFSEDAKRSAGKIYHSYISSIDFGVRGDFHIDTVFPFRERAEQSVYGLDIILPSTRILLVLEIDMCGSNFPFEVLRFGREKKELKVDLKLERNEGEGIIPGNEEETDKDEDKKDDGQPEPKIQYYFLPKFDGKPTKKSATKNDKQLIPVKHTTKKISYPNLTSDIKRLQEVEMVPARKERPKFKKAENISTNENTERDSKSVEIELENEDLPGDEVYQVCQGNYADLARFSAQYIKSLGGTISYHNLMDTYGQDEYCDITLLLDIFSTRLLSSRAVEALKMEDGSPRRLIAMNVEIYRKHFLYMEIEPVGKTAFYVFTKSAGKSDSAGKYLEFDKDDLLNTLRSYISDSDEFEGPFHFDAHRFYHKRLKVNDHVNYILKRLEIFKTE